MATDEPSPRPWAYDIVRQAIVDKNRRVVATNITNDHDAKLILSLVNLFHQTGRLNYDQDQFRNEFY